MEYVIIFITLFGKKIQINRLCVFFISILLPYLSFMIRATGDQLFMPQVRGIHATSTRYRKRALL